MYKYLLNYKTKRVKIFYKKIYSTNLAFFYFKFCRTSYKSM